MEDVFEEMISGTGLLFFAPVNFQYIIFLCNSNYMDQLNLSYPPPPPAMHGVVYIKIVI